MEFISHSEEETRNFARTMAARLEIGDVILFTGEMGAGKTAFTKGLGDFFEVTEPVTSPTFALVHEYPGKIPIFHFDLYRITNFDDLYAIGFFDYLDKDGIIAAEWSENIPGLENELDNVIKIDITKLDENSRSISISGSDFEQRRWAE